MFCSKMCTVNNLHQWSLALLLLFTPMTLYGRSFDAVSHRMRRSVSHAQLMHDKSRSIQELKRRLWIQDLLEKVHTANENDTPLSRTSSQTYSGSAVPQKPQGATKDLQDRYKVDREGPVLHQETNKAVAYKDQPLKLAIKRKKKVRLGRRRESEKKRRKARSVRTEGPDKPSRRSVLTMKRSAGLRSRTF